MNDRDISIKEYQNKNDSFVKGFDNTHELMI